MSADDSFLTHLHFCYHPEQKRRFVSGELGEIWYGQYRELFDEDDYRLYRTQCKFGYHFYEWLGAILLYEATGFLSLVEKYGCANHNRKLSIWQKVAPIPDLPDDAGYPDLFVYAPDHTDWYFCETRGASDRIGDGQRHCFRELCRASKKKVCVMWLTELRV
jgi:hypothetical protein